MDRVWPDSFVEEGIPPYNVSVLRKTLGERAGEHHHIVTTVQPRVHTHCASNPVLVGRRLPGYTSARHSALHRPRVGGGATVQLYAPWSLTLRLGALVQLACSLSRHQMGAVEDRRRARPLFKMSC